MNPEQAIQILKNLANVAVANGGIYQSVEEAATISVALQVITDLNQEKNSLTNQIKLLDDANDELRKKVDVLESSQA